MQSPEGPSVSVCEAGLIQVDSLGQVRDNREKEGRYGEDSVGDSQLRTVPKQA